MSDHLTLRVRSGTTERLERRVRATGIPARTLAARYVDEGIRRDDHPMITFVDGESGRRAALAGTGLDLWEVIATVRDNDGDLAKAADYLGLRPALIEAAVTYYGEFTDEIDAEIALNEEESTRALQQWQAGQAALTR
jgi:uncharacterized protein (DUF433 family)